jgi:transcriptional regulator with XRE-family HTH domain
MGNHNIQPPRSPSSRVSIDGNRIKFIRESKGLTQLYIATFLGVTPDTVSRWENRKYPTVKWENVEKLAAALQVDVSDILDQSEGEEPEELTEASAPAVDAAIGRRFVLAGAAALLLLIIVAVFLVRFVGRNEVTITATRFLPRHVPAGQAFPVIVRVDSRGEQPFSFILQEKLPAHFTILHGLPELASRDPETNSVKWISNSQQTPFFLAYLVQAAAGKEYSGKITFQGQIKTDDAPRFEQDVAGDRELEMSNFHWVDTNSDGNIDDEEILMVYSSGDVLKRLGVDMEGIKAIWSAGHYTWNPATNAYQVIIAKEEDQ